ncbi:MAG: hypothetical protein E7K04_04190, partial [Helicobacter sp.]|nr:hypothetical protein [Helicobacter sp.]
TQSRQFIDEANLDSQNAKSINLGINLGANISYNNFRFYADLGGTYLGNINKLYEINAGIRWGF